MGAVQRDAAGDGSAVIGLPSPKKLMFHAAKSQARDAEGSPVLPKVDQGLSQPSPDQLSPLPPFP